MRKQQARDFQEEFKRWLGPEPEQAAEAVAHLSGYSLDYVRWVAGLIGKKAWPGSDRFAEKMEELGFTDRPWRDRSRDELRHAFVHREVLRRGGQG